MKPEPCPKCRDDEPFTETVVGRWWAAECSKCRYSSATYPTEAEAVLAWNTRAVPATDEALVEVATFLKGVPVGDFPGDSYNDKLASAQRMIAAIAAMQAHITAREQAARIKALDEAAAVAKLYVENPVYPAVGWSDEEQDWFETGAVDNAAAIRAAILTLKGRQP